VQITVVIIWGEKYLKGDDRKKRKNIKEKRGNTKYVRGCCS
jgi:hypothetical protein